MPRFLRCQQHFFNWFRLACVLYPAPCSLPLTCPHCASLSLCVLPQLLTRCCIKPCAKREAKPCQANSFLAKSSNPWPVLRFMHLATLSSSACRLSSTCRLITVLSNAHMICLCLCSSWLAPRLQHRILWHLLFTFTIVCRVPVAVSSCLLFS